MKRYKCLYSIIILMVVTLSCQKDFPIVENPKHYTIGSYNDLFEAYWNGMNTNYAFWDIDPTDWDAMYRQYKPLFAKLDINNPQDFNLAYAYLKQMSAQLLDGHYGIYFLGSDIPPISPAFDRIQKRPDYHQPIDSTHFSVTIPKNYLKEAFMGSNRDLTVVSGTIDNNILYFYCSAFFLESAYTEQNNEVKGVLQYFFNRLKEMPEIKGVVIDVRGNGGGSTVDLDFLVGSMINKPLYYGYTRSKGGNGRLDYGPWIPVFVAPKKESRNITTPVVVLADMHSVSMSEIITMAIQALPNGYFMGERTWGGQGDSTPDADGNPHYGGGFSNNDFQVVASSVMQKDLKGLNLEGVGLVPDIEVKYNQQAINLGKDLQLERALELIRQGKK